MDFLLAACLRYLMLMNCLFLSAAISLILSIHELQEFLGDDFKSQGSHMAYNVADFSTQVFFITLPLLANMTIYI